jgi:hypothetical protein
VFGLQANKTKHETKLKMYSFLNITSLQRGAKQKERIFIFGPQVSGHEATCFNQKKSD